MALLQNEVTSQKTWDTFVLSRAPQALFQSWNWGEVEKKLGAALWRYGWFEGTKLIAVAQIEKVSARRGTFLHLRHGPILITQNKTHWNTILSDLKKLARTERAWFIRVSPQVEDSEKNRDLFRDLGFVSAPIHAMDAEVCWVLDLNESEDVLLAQMRKTTRYEIRRAQKTGVTVKRSTNSKDLKDFFQLYGETSDRHGFVKHTGIHEEFEEYAQDRDVLLFTAVYEGKTIAAAVILFWGDEAIYHHGASVPSRVPASHLIQWEAILEAKKRGKKVYNFWGIAPDDKPDHPWRGLTVFKTGFGGREIRYVHAQDYPVSPLYVIPRSIERVRKKLKGY